jgi:hypothetical protein
MRIILASLAVLVVFLGMVTGGYLYINRMAAGIGKVPVMFAPAPAHAVGRPVPDAARSQPAHQR